MQAFDDDFFRIKRERMVRALRDRGVRDERVLAALNSVPRQLFVPEHLLELSYGDFPLPIGHEQTISQPHMVAIMLEALELEGTERVLDVGTGSGYQAALLGRLAREVDSIEIIPALIPPASSALAMVGARNVRVRLGNGSMGFPRGAPYDAIIVGAGAPGVPPELVEQVGECGRLVIPVGGRWGQILLRIRKRNGRIEREELVPCAFVPLVGEQGFTNASVDDTPA